MTLFLNFYLIKLQNMKRIKVFILSIALSLPILAFVYSDEDDFELAKNLDIFYTLVREINLYYVDDIQPGELIKSGIDAMLDNLDPYTVYIPESKIEEYRFMTTGQYGGVGALMINRGDEIVITDPYQGSPIDSAGVKAGDVILEVDGQSIKGKSSDNISELLKGQPGTKVTLTIKRMNINIPFHKTVYRKKIQVGNVPYFGLIGNKTGYIKLSGFMENASKEVKKAFIELQEKHKIESLILDLRDNPGGLLMEAVNIVNLFVERGKLIVSTKGKVKMWNKDFKTTNEPVDKNIPLVVIVNSSSASASEIVAGAIQDLDRGVVVGERTYGKGLVQEPRQLSYNAQLKITTAKYYIPSGRCIQALDYTHRNPDGSVGKIPDSLITKFKTSRGRIVFDGGGVQPDIVTKAFRNSHIAYALMEKFMIFDFATKFALTNEKIGSAADFDISEAVYQQFISYLEDKKFDYLTKTEQNLDKLKSTAESEDIYSSAAPEFEALVKKLKHNRLNDLNRYKTEISNLLSEEIVSRFFYEKGRIENSLSHDKELKMAKEVLVDPLKQQLILSGSSN
jgi:carboxyl-terminal processing protease